MATSGEKSWPPVGRNHGHQWGEMMAAVGEKQMAVDTGGAGVSSILVAAWRGRAPPGSASGAIMQTVTAADIALCGTFRAQVGMRAQSA